MKKLFAVLVAFALVFAACDDESNNRDNSDVIGVWTGNYGSSAFTGVLTLDIAEGTWIMAFNDTYNGQATFNGTWIRDANTLTLERPNYSSSTASLSEDKLFLTQRINTSNGRPSTITLTKKVEPPPAPPSTTFLKIKNESFIELTDVVWNNASFTGSQTSIKTGTSMTKAVQAGSGYIYFKRQGSSIAVRTNDYVVVENDTTKEFVFTNNTLIAEVSNPGNTATLETFYTKPWITVKQNAAAISLYGEYNFGSILAGTEKDITFTIENIGGGNLVFENVNGNRVNLEENTSGCFSIMQQPLAASVAPTNAITFTIRFNPQTIGNNYCAVHIKTNSQNAQEFAFNVKGNGRNYIIGDTGTGGGLIFSVEGSRFLECSGDLGDYNWDTAMTVAQDYNGGGFSDWYLPNIGELTLMYSNIKAKGLGSFRDVSYWSSTESRFQTETQISFYAYLYSFRSGQSGDAGKSSIYSVRAVRAFSL